MHVSGRRSPTGVYVCVCFFFTYTSTHTTKSGRFYSVPRLSRLRLPEVCRDEELLGPHYIPLRSFPQSTSAQPHSSVFSLMKGGFCSLAGEREENIPARLVLMSPEKEREHAGKWRKDKWHFSSTRKEQHAAPTPFLVFSVKAVSDVF